jgi:Xaa-Pro aminopeptidase
MTNKQFTADEIETIHQALRIAYMYLTDFPESHEHERNDTAKIAALFHYTRKD